MMTMADNKDKNVLNSSIEREQNDSTCFAECEKIKGSKNLNVPDKREQNDACISSRTMLASVLPNGRNKPRRRSRKEMFRLCDSRSLRENGNDTNYQRFVHSIQVVLRLLQKKNTTMGIFHLYVQENYIRTKRNCS